MKFQPVNKSLINRLYKPTKLQAILDDFMESPHSAVECVFSEGEYVSVYSAQSSYGRAIRRLGLPVTARVVRGHLYLVKLIPEEDHETMA